MKNSIAPPLDSVNLVPLSIILLCTSNKNNKYCMRIYTEEYPIDWYCTECEHTTEPVSPASCPRGDLPRESRLNNFGTVCHDATRSSKSRKLSKETRRGSVDWEKKVVTGRAKYIPVKEAIKLSSGAHNTLSPTKVTCHSSPPQLKTGVNLLGRTSIKPQTVPMKFSACQDGAKFASGPSQKLKPRRHGNVEISQRQQQQPKELRVQRPVNDIQAAPTHIDEHIQKKRTADVINATKKLSYAPSVSHPVIISGSDGCPDVEPGTSNAENINNGILPDVESRTSNAANMNNSILLDVEPRTTNAVNVNNSILPYAEPRTSNAANVNNNILLDMEPRTSTADNVNNSILPYEDKYSSNPARNAVWMGSFSILKGFKHRTLIDRIQAHPPGIVRRKAYEFSKLMPEVLHFELFQCRELWMNLLQEHHPDGKNIGLYFLPRDSERSEDYFSLLESMIKKDLALRKQIGDVELLLFASTRLSPDCQRWNRKYFIWGLFHREKRHDIACQERPLTLFVRPSDDAHDSFDGDNNEVVDMEIDMIGGENVGPTDIVVRRGEHGGSSKESTATASLHRNLESLKRGPALDVKREQREDIPLGYEAYLQRVRNSLPLLKNRGVNAGVECDKRDGSR
ncbi:uncharacterized protein Fot_30079 [Forsythia ovata]|uniref:AIPP2-like SPOC-like domain-containing protein n=1 Tax=Forsythia ovata TaxID=205694 RepID=A0ABD1TU94_9LAMI